MKFRALYRKWNRWKKLYDQEENLVAKKRICLLFWLWIVSLILIAIFSCLATYCGVAFSLGKSYWISAAIIAVIFKLASVFFLGMVRFGIATLEQPSEDAPDLVGEKPY